MNNAIMYNYNAFKVNFVLCFLLFITPLNIYAKSIDFKGRIEKLKNINIQNPHLFTLENGLKIVIDVDKRAPVVSHTIWYRVGSADEKEGESGIAHFLEHLMFRGTDLHKEGYFSKRINEIGGNDNAFTTHDLTAYYQNIPVSHIREVMALEANRMRNIRLTESELINERNIVLEERALRTDSNPTAQLLEQLYASLFRNHPYGKPVIGWKHEISALNKKQVMQFYNQYYAPNNAIVTIVGNVDPDKIHKIAQETYGQIKPSAHIALKRLRPKEPPQRTTREITLKHKNVTQPHLFLMLEGISAHQNPEKFYALSSALNHIASGSHSKLYQSLVKKQKLALSVNSFINSDKIDNPAIIFHLIPTQNTPLKTLKSAFLKALIQALETPFSYKDIAREQASMLTNFMTQFDQRSNRAHLWGKNLAFNNTITDIKNIPNIIASVDHQESFEILKEIIKPHNFVWGYLLKADTQ